MIQWLYKWLPIIFGCHCRPDRSFFLRGKQFPICARCTGELVGMVLGVILCFFRHPPVWLTLVLMVPMVTDGLIQLKTAYESTNPRRFVTGLLFGCALTAFFIVTLTMTWQYGYRLGKRLL